MSKVQDFFGAAPKTVLNKPYMHVQDQNPLGTWGGTSVSGFNDRDINTVVSNEIPGASLNSSYIDLPAGKYYIQGQSSIYCSATTAGRMFIRDDSDTILIEGNSSNNLASGTGLNVDCGKELTLTNTTRIKATTYHNVGTATAGLGAVLSHGLHEIHTDLKIWQLDATVSTPVLINDKLYPLPGNTLVTGNMHGLEYEYTSSSTITVQPGICMDSTNTEVLDLATQQVVTIGSVINTIYNLFLCNDGVVRTDTDVNGSGLSAYSFRWIGFATTDATGVLYSFIMRGDTMAFTFPPMIGETSDPTIDGNANIVIPESRVESCEVSVGTSTIKGCILQQEPVIAGFYMVLAQPASVGNEIYIQRITGTAFKYQSALIVRCHSCIMKR